MILSGLFPGPLLTRDSLMLCNLDHVALCMVVLELPLKMLLLSLTH